MSTNIGKRRASDPIGIEGRSVRERIAPDLAPPILIAHSPRHQKFFEAKKLAWGVLWEIARLVTARAQESKDTAPLSFDHIKLDVLDQLRGSNAEAAPGTAQCLFNASAGDLGTGLASVVFQRERAVRTPWKELDIETANLANNPLSGLGGGTTDAPMWYGGKIAFRGRLISDPKADPPYHVVLEKAELRESCRFTRTWGSWSIIRIAISQQLHNDSTRLLEYFLRPFVIMGRVYRAMTGNRDCVFLAYTNDLYVDGQIVPQPWSLGDASPMPIQEYWQWCNPIESNSNQTMAKYASRFALMFSSSVPGIQLADDKDIIAEPDIISTDRSDMTDGCGFTTRAVMAALRRRYQGEEISTAIQVRIAGYKGLVQIHPSEQEKPEDRSLVWLRPSQLKIRYPGALHPSMLWIDLLRTSHMRSPARLGVETIINMAENHVPSELFCELLRTGLTELVGGLTTWEGEDSMYQLWHNVSRSGGVIASRLAREISGQARLRGLSGSEQDDEEEEEDEDGVSRYTKLLTERSTAWWADYVSGCPSTLEETVMVLLDAGFKPQDLPVLKAKLHDVVKSAINAFIKRYRLQVPMSCIAFLVPDPFGVLGPDEIQIKSSHRNLLGIDGYETDQIVGDVLLTRNPCKLPTDIQKFKAVAKPELYSYNNVIVCSVQGQRRLADLLAGGDYDGDKGTAFWDPRFVQSFVSADLKYSFEPPGVAENFSKVNEKVEDFIARTRHLPLEAQVQEKIKIFLQPLRDAFAVGKYSTFHEKSIYRHGYAHPTTIELAYMFCKVLDGAKTGLTVRTDVFSRHKREFHYAHPEWRAKIEDSEELEDNKPPLRRDRRLHRFIMDEIHAEAHAEHERHLRVVEEQFGTGRDVVVDTDLTAPWLDAVKLAQRAAEKDQGSRQEDLDKIMEHVKAVREQWSTQRGPAKGCSRSVGKGTGNKSGSFTGQPITVRQDTLRDLSKKFASISDRDDILLSRPEILRLAASYAYLHDSEQPKRWSRFPWDVALRELSAIKVSALGPWKPVTIGFYERFQLKTAFFNRSQS